MSKKNNQENERNEKGEERRRVIGGIGTNEREEDEKQEESFSQLIDFNDLNDFSFEAVDFDTKFRSMHTLNESYPYYSPSSNQFNVYSSSSIPSDEYYNQNLMSSPSSYEKTSLNQPNKEKLTYTIQENLSIQQSQSQTIPSHSRYNISIDSSNITVPDKPFYIGPSQFVCSFLLSDLILKVHQKLDTIFEVSYDFIQSSCRVSSLFFKQQQNK